MNEELVRKLIGALETIAICQDEDVLKAIEAAESSDERYSLDELEEVLFNREV